MKITAQSVQKQDLQVRRIFSDNINKVQASREDKVEHAQANAMEMVEDIMFEWELSIPASMSLAPGPVKGFESGDFLGTGQAVVQGKLQSHLGHVFRLQIFAPIVRGNLYKPSVMSINGAKTTFTAASLLDVLSSAETTKVTLHDQYLPSENFTHMINQQRPLFSAPSGATDDEDKYFDLYVDRTDGVEVPTSRFSNDYNM